MKTTTISTIASLALDASAVPVNIQNGHIALSLDINVGQDVLGGLGGIGAQAFDNQLFAFSSQHFIQAVPEQVVSAENALTGGLLGALGNFNFGINRDMNMICYNITLHNFQGDFDSPAVTATHIHEAAAGLSGPPRIAFPNPEPVNGDVNFRNSAGCIKGPFATGVLVDGIDSGEGFHVSFLEDNPAAFFADTHSSLALPGAVRGQLA